MCVALGIRKNYIYKFGQGPATCGVPPLPLAHCASPRVAPRGAVALPPARLQTYPPNRGLCLIRDFLRAPAAERGSHSQAKHERSARNRTPQTHEDGLRAAARTHNRYTSGRRVHGATRRPASSVQESEFRVVARRKGLGGPHRSHNAGEKVLREGLLRAEEQLQKERQTRRKSRSDLKRASIRRRRRRPSLRASR